MIEYCAVCGATEQLADVTMASGRVVKMCASDKRTYEREYGPTRGGVTRGKGARPSRVRKGLLGE